MHWSNVRSDRYKRWMEIEVCAAGARDCPFNNNGIEINEQYLLCVNL